MIERINKRKGKLNKVYENILKLFNDKEGITKSSTNHFLYKDFYISINKCVNNISIEITKKIEQIKLNININYRLKDLFTGPIKMTCKGKDMPKFKFDNKEELDKNLFKNIRKLALRKGLHF